MALDPGLPRQLRGVLVDLPGHVPAASIAERSAVPCGAASRRPTRRHCRVLWTGIWPQDVAARQPFRNSAGDHRDPRRQR